MKIRQITETTAGSTSSGSIASVESALGGINKRMQKPPKSPKVEKGKKYANTLRESAIQEEKIEEQDLIIVPGMRKSKDSSFIPHKADRRDHEVEMARSDLYAAAKDAMRLYQLLQNRTEDEGLMGWQQSYITLAADYLNSVADSIEYNAKVKGSLDEMTGGVVAGGMSNFEGKAVHEISDFKRKEIEHELRHEKNNYAVAIDGKVWKVFADEKQANNIARSLQRKGKKATVHLTGASVSESKKHKCPECGGEMVSEELMNEKKDACYYKVKSRYKVWPSAYASGALVKCRKKGAKNWGSKSK